MWFDLSQIEKKKAKCYCINIRRAANAVTAYYDNILKPLDITITQYSMLSSIYTLKACNTSDLAAHMGLDRTSMVRNLKVLVKKELVVVTVENQRKKTNSLSKTGKDTLEKARSLWDNAQKEIDEYLGAENIQKLLEITQKLEELP